MRWKVFEKEILQEEHREACHGFQNAIIYYRGLNNVNKVTAYFVLKLFLRPRTFGINLGPDATPFYPSRRGTHVHG